MEILDPRPNPVAVTQHLPCHAKRLLDLARVGGFCGDAGNRSPRSAHGRRRLEQTRADWLAAEREERDNLPGPKTDETSCQWQRPAARRTRGSSSIARA
jgi:hypothetical protein